MKDQERRRYLVMLAAGYRDLNGEGNAYPESAIRFALACLSRFEKTPEWNYEQSLRNLMSENPVFQSQLEKVKADERERLKQHFLNLADNGADRGDWSTSARNRDCAKWIEELGSKDGAIRIQEVHPEAELQRLHDSRKTLKPFVPVSLDPKLCAVKGCSRDRKAMGLCLNHYFHWKLLIKKGLADKRGWIPHAKPGSLIYVPLPKGKQSKKR